MVLAPNDMADPKVGGIGHPRKEVEPATVLATNEGIRDQPRIDPLGSTDEVVPDNWRLVIQFEPPMRCSALGYWRTIGLALVNGRQAAPEQHLSAELKLFLGFIAGIHSPRFLQSLELPLIEIQTFGLTDDGIGPQPHPIKIIANRLIELSR